MASQPLDRIPPQWLTNPHNPAMNHHSRHLSTPIESVEEKEREGWGGGVLVTTATKPLETAKTTATKPLQKLLKNSKIQS